MKTNNKKQLIHFVLSGLIILGGMTNLRAQNTYDDWARLSRYKQENKDLINSTVKTKTVFFGNSITEGWVGTHPDFFTMNGYIGRGIGGQTVPQFLSRFRQDAIALNPQIVVINGGINDIAQNAGEYDSDYTFDCIKSMAELAQTNNIKVILTSVLPAANIPWKSNITNVPLKISELNRNIKNYADEKGFTYVDYYSQMVDPNKGMKKEYTTDGVHVTAKGYKVMEGIIKEAIDKLIAGQM